MFLKDFHVTAPASTFDVRKVELTPLEQRKLTFDSHAMVTELESSGENNTREVSPNFSHLTLQPSLCKQGQG